MPKHHEDEQQAEGQGRHEEEVDGHGLAKMRLEEGPPGGRRPRGGPTMHVLRDGQFGHGVP
jgi:hypothetical protein